MVSYDNDEEVEDISEEEWEDCDVEDDMPLLENHVEESKSFEVIDPTASSEFQIIDESSETHSAIKDATHSEFSSLSKVISSKGKGKTRKEAFKELDIDPVELLPSGELKLPSGKVIGHRDYKYIDR